MKKLARTAVPVSEAALQALANKTAKGLGVSTGVMVMTSSQVDVPMTWGLFRPVVLLPESAQWSKERLRVVLIHELAHIKRFDFLTNLVSQVVCMVLWFNPFV